MTIVLAGWFGGQSVVSTPSTSSPKRCLDVLFAACVRQSDGHHATSDQQTSRHYSLLLAIENGLTIYRCSLDGEALQGIMVGQLARLTLLTRDQFGNACAVGGDSVDVDLRSPDGRSCPAFVVLYKIGFFQDWVR